MLELAVIIPLAPMVAGEEFERSAIPLHPTVLSNVQLHETFLPTFVERIALIARSTPETIGRAGPTDLFGKKRDIVVTTLEESPSIRNLHERLATVALELGATPIEPSHNFDGFRSHVTRTFAGETILPTDTVQLTDLVLLDCTAPTRRVLTTTQLST